MPPPIAAPKPIRFPPSPTPHGLPTTSIQLLPPSAIYSQHCEMTTPQRHAPSRLLSPIQLATAIHRSTLITPPSCEVPAKRRAKHLAAALRRRRPLSRVEYQPERSSHVFDHLPWISALDATPEHSTRRTSHSDIADLSLLDAPNRGGIQPSGPGPIRHRKHGLRTRPFSPIPLNHPPVTEVLRTSRPSLPFTDSCLDARPCTPPRPSFIPSRVLFHNLMPVLDSHTNEDTPECNVTSPSGRRR